MDADRSALPPRTTASSLALALSTDAGCRVVSVAGELDAATLDRFTDCLLEVLAQRPRAVIIDLSRVAFCAARALEVLLRFTDDAHSHGVAVALIADHHPVLHPVDVLALTPVLPMHRRIADASRWFGLLPDIPSPRVPSEPSAVTSTPEQ